MANVLLSRSGLIVAMGLLVLVGGILVGGKIETWFRVAPLEAEVERLNQQLTSCGDNEARLTVALARVGAQVRELAAGCATTVDQANQAAQDALRACEDLPEDATVEEWNAWLTACSPPQP